MAISAPTNQDANKSTHITVSKMGLFVYQGKKYSLFQLIYMVLNEHAQVISKSVAGELEIMNQMNKDYKICSELQEAIQGIRPDSTSGTVSYAKIKEVAETLADKYPEEFSVTTYTEHGKSTVSGINTVWEKFGVTDIAGSKNNNSNDDWTQQKVDQLIEGLRSELSSVGQDQDAQKVRLQRGLHAQDETWNLLSASEKSITQNVDQIIQRV